MKYETSPQPYPSLHLRSGPRGSSCSAGISGFQRGTHGGQGHGDEARIRPRRHLGVFRSRREAAGLWEAKTPSTPSTARPQLTSVLHKRSVCLRGRCSGSAQNTSGTQTALLRAVLTVPCITKQLCFRQRRKLSGKQRLSSRWL